VAGKMLWKNKLLLCSQGRRMGWLPQLGGFGFFVLTFRISLLSHSFFSISFLRHYIVHIVWWVVVGGGATGMALEHWKYIASATGSCCF